MELWTDLVIIQRPSAPWTVLRDVDHIDVKINGKRSICGIKILRRGRWKAFDVQTGHGPYLIFEDYDKPSAEFHTIAKQAMSFSCSLHHGFFKLKSLLEKLPRIEYPPWLYACENDEKATAALSGDPDLVGRVKVLHKIVALID